MTLDRKNDWIGFILQPGEEVRFRITERLTHLQTEHQRIDIVSTQTFGKGLFIDEKPQSSDTDVFIFNEALVHPGLMQHLSPQSIFVAGVGSGAGVREILRHSTVKRVVACELDREAMEFYQLHLGEWGGGALDDARVCLEFCNARDWLETTEETFDCVIVDLPDPLFGGTSNLSFTREFYELVSSRLNEGGILVTQAGRTNINNLEYHCTVLSTLRSVFRDVVPYSIHIPFYAECWGFAMASNDNFEVLTPHGVEERRRSRHCSDTRFYDGYTHGAMMVYPRYLREAILVSRPVSTDVNPFTVK